MKTEEITPALSPAEWRAPFDFAPSSCGEVNDQMVCVTPRNEVLTIKARHAHAAIALNGQPFGFTWEDVDCLRACAKQQRDIDGDREAIAYAGQLSHGDDLESLAARIEALLPPRTA